MRCPSYMSPAVSAWAPPCLAPPPIPCVLDSFRMSPPALHRCPHYVPDSFCMGPPAPRPRRPMWSGCSWTCSSGRAASPGSRGRCTGWGTRCGGVGYRLYAVFLMHRLGHQVRAGGCSGCDRRLLSWRGHFTVLSTPITAGYRLSGPGDPYYSTHTGVTSYINNQVRLLSCFLFC